MAQPLARPEETGSGIDAAVARLEQAFLRLEGAVGKAHTGHHSLKADHEKLNHLLHEADCEIGRLKEAIHTVSDRLDRTIHILEKDA